MLSNNERTHTEDKFFKSLSSDTFKINLEYYLEKHSKSANTLAKEMGYDSGSRISRILRGEGEPSFQFLIDLVKLDSELSLDWLVTGKGNMYKGNETTGKLTGDQVTAIGSAISNLNKAQEQLNYLVYGLLKK